MKKLSSAPFVRSAETRLSYAADFLVAAAPVLVWSVYIFGARVLTICSISVFVCFALDFIAQKFIFHAGKRACFDPMNAVYGIFTAFTIPVAAPLWIPAVAAVFTVIAKNLRLPSGRRIFNPYIFSAAAMNLIFRPQMTCFTRPLAYFNALTPALDEKLVGAYRVLSPLQYGANGSVYEDGVIPQLVGYAAGNIGEIAVAAMILGSVWLFIRKRAEARSTFGMLAVVFLLAYFFPSEDAEESYYVFSMLFSGGLIFISIFALNERSSLPLSKTGRLAAALFCGFAVFLGRKFGGGFEWGYIAVLAVNALSPLIDKYTLPRAAGVDGKKQKAAAK